MIFVDSNVLIDVLRPVKSEWYDWSADKIDEYRNSNELIINPIVYAEIAYGFESVDELESALKEMDIKKEGLPWQAAFIAGQCYKLHRERGGSRTTPLADYYIGAHAALLKIPLLTRNAKDYKQYFPKLELITP